MKAFASLLLVALIGCSTAIAPKCSPFAVAVFEYRINPDGVLERFEFASFSDRKSCKRVPVTAIGDAWLKTACVTLMLENFPPSYQAGMPAKSRYIFRLFNPDRPDVIYRSGDSGSSPENPLFDVREEILKENAKTRDGSVVCNQDMKRPTHNAPMQPDEPRARPSQVPPASTLRPSGSAEPALCGFAAIAVLSPNLFSAARR